MKILVPVKRVPDPYSRITLTTSGELDVADLKWVVNPFDEIALEEAVRMKERGEATEVVAVSVGGPECEAILRVALAMGADRALLVEEPDSSDPSLVAAMLSSVVRHENPGLVLMGKQATDDDNSQVGPRLAARLGFPQATFASDMKLTSDRLRVRVSREVDAGRETLELTLPAVVTTDLRLNEPRYVSLPAILKARAKPLHRFDGFVERPTGRNEARLVKLEMPPERTAGRRVGSVQDLVDALRNEARVL